MDSDTAVTQLIARLFGVPPEQVSDATRRGALEQWDSLGHINLLESLRAEFGIKVSPEAALDLETVADVKRLVRERRRTK